MNGHRWLGVDSWQFGCRHCRPYVAAAALVPEVALAVVERVWDDFEGMANLSTEWAATRCGAIATRVPRWVSDREMGVVLVAVEAPADLDPSDASILDELFVRITAAWTAQELLDSIMVTGADRDAR